MKKPSQARISKRTDTLDLKATDKTPTKAGGARILAPKTTTEVTLDLPLLTPHLAVLAAGLKLHRRPRIVDVGANPMVTDSPYADFLAMDGCDVVGFEPHPAAFDELMKIKSPRETYFPFAVGDGSQKTLRIYRSSGFTSVFDPYIEGCQYLDEMGWHKLRGTLDFETVRLDDRAEVGDFDLLKIDIQGGECDVFRGGVTALKHCMVVIVELRYYPLYRDEPMLGGVDDELRKQGFFLHKFLFNKSKMIPSSQAGRLKKRRNMDQLIDGDGVYLRDMAQIQSYSDLQLCNLCMTAASVFESHSLVLHVLDELVRRGRVAEGLPKEYVDALPAELQA